MTGRTLADLQAEVLTYRQAALREHERARYWQQRAAAAEARLALYDQRERRP